MISSILFEQESQRGMYTELSQDCADDLRISQVLSRLESIGSGKTVRTVFRRSLTQPELIRFRQDVMRDLQNKEVRLAVKTGSDRIRAVREELDEVYRTCNFKQDLIGCGRVLHLADEYLNAVSTLGEGAGSGVCSAGLRRFFRELDGYCSSDSFCKLKSRVEEQYRQLDEIHFCMLLKDSRVRVRPWEGEMRLDAEIERLFARFTQDAPGCEAAKRPEMRTAHAIDEKILELLTRWYPSQLEMLRSFPREYPDFPESGLVRFSEEIGFYLSWLQLIEPLADSGLPFCCPELVHSGEELSCTDGFDLALALEMHDQGRNTVTNSFAYKEQERILVVTGPNQGGKTTFARYVGQAFYWASLGCLIPGSRAALRCFDGLYTHFNREEDLDTLNGKLKNELLRLRKITQQATEKSVVIINEIYASTTLEDAVFLGKAMMRELTELGCLAVCVTFLDELAEDSVHTVSMMSTVGEDGRRLFKIIRKQADGLAYAMQLARRCGLDYQTLTRRLER